MAKERRGSKQKTFAVFGLGSFGTEVCRVLAEKRALVLAFDKRPEAVEKIREAVKQASVLDSADEDAGAMGESTAGWPLDGVDVAIVAIGGDMEASILTTALLKNVGVPYIVARACSDIHTRVLRMVGATEVINLEIEEGRRVASRLLATEAMDTISVTDDYSIVEFPVPESMIGKSLEKLDLRKKHQVNVIAKANRRRRFHGTATRRIFINWMRFPRAGRSGRMVYSPVRIWSPETLRATPSESFRESFRWISLGRP